MINDKKISVIMGIYNCADTIEESLDSIVNQTYSNWEVIMCDDGSQDSTFYLAEQYVVRYPNKFKLLKNENNMGLNFTLNRCLSCAVGDFIARMDGDDISLPNRFEREVAFFNEHPEFAIVSTSMVLFDEFGDWGETQKPITEPCIKDFVNHSPVHCHAPCMIRREAILDVGGYTVDKRLLRFEDCNLWFKLYGKGYRGYNLSESLYKMRDNRDALRRRKTRDRLRGVYVLYTGFKIVNMPAIYYLVLIPKFIKYVLIGFIPISLQGKIHKYINSQRSSK